MKETKTPSGLLKMDPNTIQIHRKILSKSYCIRDYSQGLDYFIYFFLKLSFINSAVPGYSPVYNKICREFYDGFE